jgi:hypothetical protein
MEACQARIFKWQTEEDVTVSEVDYVEVNRKAHELTYTHGPTARGYADRQAELALAAGKTDECAFWKAVAQWLTPR